MRTFIRIENIKPGTKGTLCYADVIIGIRQEDKPDVDLVTISECRLGRSEKGEYLGLPCRSWKDASGETRYAKLVTMPGHSYKAALAAFQEAWKAYEPEPPATPATGGEDPFA